MASRYASAPNGPPAPASGPAHAPAASVQPLVAFAVSLVAAALSIALLALVSGHPGVVFGPDPASRLLAFQVVAVALLLVTVSLGSRVRISLQMILVYMAIYLLIPGYHHSSTNSFPFFNLQYEQSVRFTAALVISVFLIATIAGFVLGEATGPKGLKKASLGSTVFFPNQTLLLTLTALSIGSAIIYLATVGPAFAFGRRSDWNSLSDDILTTGLLFTLPRVICFMAFAYAFLLFRRSRTAGVSLVFLVVTFIPFAVTNYPLVLARFVLFGVCLFFLLQIFDFRSERARLALNVLFVGGAMVAMPITNELTRGSGKVGSADFAEIFDDYVTTGDFDGLQSVQNAVIYVDQQGTRGGIQLLSAALFFVPRAIWDGKAVATGEITSRAAGYWFNNISQPLPSEFYVDFGMAGMAIASLTFGFLVARLDAWIDRNWEDGPSARLVAGVVVAYTIIFMRGSLLGIIAPIVVFALGIAVIIRFGMVKPERIRLRRRARGVSEAAAQSPRAIRHARRMEQGAR
jgi:hypothetical protein